MKKAIIFSDGASRGNPGKGGYGAIVYTENGNERKVFELGGREENTTNNRMEMKAALEALSYLEEKKFDAHVLVCTDSSYLANGASKWLPGWSRSGWRTKEGGEVLNKDLWKAIYAILPKMTVSWKILPGHSGIEGNERCDEIATTFADGKKADLYYGDAAFYKVSLTVPDTFAKKTEEKKGSGKAYSYVSLVGGEIKVHKTWKECEDRVKGKSGVRFKKALSADQEEEIKRDFLS